MVGFVDDGPRIWPIPPDWGKGVQESLAWGTDVMIAPATAESQHRSWRASPRVGFEFEVLADGKARRLADMLLAGYAGEWLLPIWHDVQWRSGTLAASATSVACATDGYEFVDGGKALLYTDARTWEVVEIDTVAIDHLGLVAATTADFGPGSRLYPLRRARVRQGAEERLSNDALSRRPLGFDLVEPCDWPLLESPTQYLGHDVLETWPDESNDPSASYARLEQGVDYDTAFPVVHDLAGVALRAQKSQWKLFGRAQYAWFRSLLFGRCGRLTPIWVPSFAADLQLVGDIAGGGALLPVEWAGYVKFGLGQPNRQDLRIELNDGTVFHRRVTAAAEDGDSENLTLDASLSGSSIAPGAVRSIGFMALSTLASDEIELDHATDADGLTTATTGWQAVVPDAV